MGHRYTVQMHKSHAFSDRNPMNHTTLDLQFSNLSYAIPCLSHMNIDCNTALLQSHIPCCAAQDNADNLL